MSLRGTDKRKARGKPGPGVRKILLGSIQNKIIVPFLVLTAIVAAVGTFVVTRLVAASVQDRLTSQLIETSRAANDSIVNWEQSHLDILRLVAYTIGVPEALQEHDSASLTTSLLALAANQNAYMLLGLDKDGIAVADVRRDNDRYQTGLFAQQDLSLLPMITPVLEGREDVFGDKFAGVIKIDDEIVLVTTAPVTDTSGELVGVIAVGTPVRQMLLQTKEDVLADLTLYDADGKALETTFVLTGESTLESLSITSDLYRQALFDTGSQTLLREIVVNQRSYQTAYVPLVIRRDTLGVLGISYSTTVITTLIRTNRSSLAIIFSLVIGLVFAAGYAVAKGLSDPIRKLARTAEAVRAGNLDQQSGVRTSDEIGVLGVTFDAMTRQLDAQTKALYLAYEEQEKETAFLSAILTSTADGVVVILPDGAITRLNPAAEEIIMANQEFWLEELSRLMTQLLRGEHPRRRVEIANTWIEALAAPVHTTTTGDEIGVVMTLRDITDQVLDERMRTAFIMQMSHELYTPLTTIKGYAELAKVVLKGENVRADQFIEMAIDQSNNLNRLIGQMLDVAQMTGGGLELRRDSMYINQAIRAAVSEYQEVIEIKSLEVQVDLQEMGAYHGDAERLTWAFKHLVDNACTYTLPGGKITIHAGTEDNSYIFRIRDTGIGIAQRELPRVFERFFRGYPVAPDGSLIDVRGAGLGLYVVDQVVRAHGGRVDIWSKQGVGTEVTVILPYEAPVISEGDALQSVSRRR